MKQLFILFSISLLASYGFAQNNFNNFLNRVNNISVTERQAVADSFLTVITENNLPLVEDDSVYFIYNGEANSVVIVSDFTGWNPWLCEMEKIAGTTFYYHAKWFESDARIEYKYLIDENNWILDPENDQSSAGGMGTNSVLKMVNYTEPIEMDYSATNQGTLENIKIYSTLLDRDYNVSVYLPFGYDSSSESYGTVYFQDGSDYLQYAKAQNVMDYVMDNNMVEPLIGVFVSPTDRAEEYCLSEASAYVATFCNDIVSYIDANYRTIQDRTKRLVIGDSDGAGISGKITEQYNDVFANVAFQSIVCGLHEYFRTPLLDFQDIKIHYTWGKYDNTDWALNQEIYKDTLVNRGHKMEWAVYPEGHNFGFWGAHIDDILEYFFPKTTSVFTHQAQSLMQVYPNPCMDEFKLIFNENLSSEKVVKIYNALGIEINEISIGTDGIVSMMDYKPGYYLINCTVNGRTETKKILKN